MSYQGNVGRIPSVEPDNRGFSQMVFVCVGVTIVVGGLWLLYQSTAPYHPDVPISEGSSVQAVES
ncbi:MAG: hypothetical protein ACJAVM_001112 [Sulfitobacter sp.]|jgi:hypothetical protein